MNKSRNTLLVIVGLALLATVDWPVALAVAFILAVGNTVWDHYERAGRMPTWLPPLPFGYELRKIESEYHGHPDGLRYGEGPETIYLVVPVGTGELPKVDLIHGTWVQCWKELDRLPDRARIFQDGRWMPLGEYMARYQAPDSFQQTLREMRWASVPVAVDDPDYQRLALECVGGADNDSDFGDDE